MTDSPVIGSASFEVRATTSKLKADLEAAGREAKVEMKKVEDATRHAQAEMKRAFSDSGHSEFERSMRIIRNASDYTEDEVRGAAERIARDLKGRYRDMGADIGRTFMGISRTAQLAFAGITAYALKLAADAEKIEQSFDMVFSNAADSARRFSDELADATGRDAVVLREQMTKLQLVLTGTGVAAETAAEMVNALTRSGVDAGSLFNVSDAEALQKIISGLTGETEPLKAFGVVINQAAMEAELLRLGFKGNASEASEAAKSIARANIIMEKLAVAEGRAASEADSATGKTRAMTAEFNKAARDLGTQLLPMMTRLFGSVTDVLKAFNDLPGGVQIAGLAFLGLIAAGGPIAGLIANLARVIKLARDTRLALIAAGAAGPAAGVGAGAGVAGGVAGATAPLAAGAVVVGVGTASFAPVPDDVKAYNADPSHPGRRFGESNSAWRARGGLTFREWQGVRSANQSTADLESSAAAAVTGQARAAGFTPPSDAASGLVTGFSLTPAQQTGTSNERGGRASGRSEADLAAQREMLRLQGELDLLRATGDEAGVRAKQREIDLVTLTKQYEAAGIANAAEAAKTQVDAIAAAEDTAREIDGLLEQSARRNERNQRAREREAEEQRRLNDILLDQLGIEAHLADLEGSPEAARQAERRLWIEERINQILHLRPELTAAAARQQANGEADAQDAARRTGQLREEFRNAFAGGIRAAIDGDLGGFFESLADRFTDRMLDNLADDLFDLLAKAAGSFKGGGSGGGWMSAIASLFSIGKNATGTDFWRGGLTSVNEMGGEIMNLPRGTQIIPHDLSKRMVDKAGGAPAIQRIYVEVGVNDDRFNAYVAEQATPIAAHAAATAYTATRNDQISAARRSRQRFT